MFEAAGFPEAKDGVASSRMIEALVVANQGENFCAGANLMLVLLLAQEGEWDDLENAIRQFQKANS